MTALSKSFGFQGPSRPHLNVGEVKDIREDVEGAFSTSDSRLGFPSLGKVTGGGAFSLASVPAAAAIKGSNFWQGQVKASLVRGIGIASLTFTANRPGTPGNAIQVVIVQGTTLDVTVLGNVITISLATLGSTAAAVKVKYDTIAAAVALAQVVSGGAGTVLVAAQTPLAGGVGDGLDVLINGLDQTVAGAVTETDIPMVVSALTGAAAGDAVSLRVRSNNAMSNTLSLVIIT